MTFSPTTIAAQREDLLRQVVFNRPDAVPSDDKRLFTAEIGLTVHAYMADVYAAALAELDPERAEEVAQELAEDLDAGSLPAYAWERAAELGHDPQAWRDQWLAGRKDLPLAGPERLHAELKKLRTELEQARTSLAEPIIADWTKGITHTETGTTVECVDADNRLRGIALELDPEHREALGLMLIDPDGEMDQADNEPTAELERLRAADAAVLAVMAHYRDAPDDASRWAILSDLAIARDGHIPEHLTAADCDTT